MIRIVVPTALAACIVLPAHADDDTDQPHREWGQIATIDMPLAEATACITRGIARSYERVLPVPAENGTDIDAGPGGGFWGVAHDPWLRLRVRQDGDAVTLRVLYRHPVSQKQVTKEVERLQKRCLKVRSIAALNE